MRNGDVIERNIEGIWFEAVLEEIDNKRKVVYLKYLDDGNREESVPFAEIRDKPMDLSIRYLSISIYLYLTSLSKHLSLSDNKDTSHSKIRYNSKEDKGHKDTNSLLKPLAGLIEDDSSERYSHRPTVIGIYLSILVIYLYI
jgi:hypothetical protein